MITIKDIAKITGFSITTVSQVLNDNDIGIKKESRDIIIKTANELNYKPNFLARGLIKKYTNTIGVVIPDITNPFFPQIVKAIEDEANKLGYNIILCNTDNDINKENLYLDVMRTKYVDGIIFTSSTQTSEKREILLKGYDRPVVLIDRVFNSLSHFPKVYVDGYQGLVMGTMFLLEKGHSEVAFISGPETSLTGQERLRGYRFALEEKGITPSSDMVYYGEYDIESGKRAVDVLLNKNPRITAIITANDMMALGVMQALKSRELNIPHEVSIVGFDDVQIASLVDPPLTTIAQPSSEMGKNATKMLVSLIKGDTLTQSDVILEPQLVIRESVTSRLE